MPFFKCSFFPWQFCHFWSFAGLLLLFLAFPLLKASSSSSSQLHCYSCTTLNANRLLAEVEDPSWRKWLEQVQYVPRTKHCADPFLTVSALRHGVRSLACEHGICLKLWFREGSSNEDGQVWRSCVPHGGSQQPGTRLREDCTRIESSQGQLEICTCEGILCNGATTPNIHCSNLFILLLVILCYLLVMFGTFLC